MRIKSSIILRWHGEIKRKQNLEAKMWSIVLVEKKLRSHLKKASNMFSTHGVVLYWDNALCNQTCKMSKNLHTKKILKAKFYPKKT